jgi:peptide/nickel transport system substrate-binding protein
MKKVLVIVLLVFLGALSGGPTSADTRPELTVAITRDENTLTPFTYVTGSPGVEVMSLIYDALMVVNLDNEVIPWMIEELTVDEKSQSFQFKLKKGQKWHDGHPVTADDVLFSFSYPLSQSSSRWIKICRQIDQVTYDGFTISINLKRPNPNFLREGLADLPIIPKHVYENLKDATDLTTPLGSGPFRLTSYLPGQAYTLTATDYFLGRPLVSVIRMPIINDKSSAMQALVAGRLDSLTSSLAPEAVELLGNRKNLKVMRNIGYSPIMLYFNCQRVPFDNYLVRRAVSLAIEKLALTKTVQLGYATPGAATLAAPDTDLFQRYPPELDVAKAGALLDQAGFKEKNQEGLRLMPDGRPMEFTLLVYSDARRVRTAEMIAENLLTVGVKLTVKTMDSDTVDSFVWPDFNVQAGRNYDLTIWGWSAPVQLNPSSPVSLLSSDPEMGNLNIAGFKNDLIDDLCRQFEKVADFSERSSIGQKILAEAAELAPFIVLYYEDVLSAVSTNKFDGWKVQKGVGVINKFSFLPMSGQN